MIYALLAWDEGVFELEQGIPSPRQTITANWSVLLLKRMRRMDEEMADLETYQDEEKSDRLRRITTDTAEGLAVDLRGIAGIKGTLVRSREGQVLNRNGGGAARTRVVNPSKRRL